MSVRASATRPEAKRYRSTTCGGEGILMGVPFFAPAPRWDARGNHAVYAMGAGYAVTVEDMATGRRRSLRRPMEPPPATEALALAEARAAPQWVRSPQGMCPVPAAEAVAGRGYQPAIPAVDSVAVAWDGHVWVKRWTPAEADRAIDIFDPTGAYIGTLTDWPFPVGFLPGGDLLVVETEEDGVQWVTALRVVVPGAS